MKIIYAFQRGFSMISAMFLIVVLAALAAGMASLSAIQHESMSLDMQGARAYQAARAGIEWGLYQSLITSPGGACATVSQSFVPAAPTLKNFTVTVTCADSSSTPVMRLLTATACNQPDGSGNCPNPNPVGDYVERKLQAEMERQ